MDRGLYIAASGMAAELRRQDQLANDLANASTPGYKADRAAVSTFGELLLTNRASGIPVGRVGLGARVAELRTDMAQGPMRETGEPLDLALSGPGFLAVQTQNGVRYTRNGSLALDADGRLVTTTGLPVLGTDGRPIAIPRGADVSIAADGTITADGRTAGRLAVVSLEGAAKEGDSLFSGTPGERPGETEVKQGFLEGSGVDPIRAMVDMLVSLRAFESAQRAIRTIDETLGRGINSGGSPGGS